ncbi:(2Fe-2S)-binding protein [Ruminococcus sp. 5_1_39BFAA]|uniref:(2Fe-2S)-binding protein n=1 Tax=Ruminococcus sp. 5_1_39BFAA TaxID=457412 RepID=UPI0035626845
MKREKTACHCKNVTYGMIEDAIKQGAKSYEEVEKQLRFGTGCGKCKEFISFLVKDILDEMKSMV